MKGIYLRPELLTGDSESNRRGDELKPCLHRDNCLNAIGTQVKIMVLANADLNPQRKDQLFNAAVVEFLCSLDLLQKPHTYSESTGAQCF